MFFSSRWFLFLDYMVVYLREGVWYVSSYRMLLFPGVPGEEPCISMFFKVEVGYLFLFQAEGVWWTAISEHLLCYCLIMWYCCWGCRTVLILVRLLQGEKNCVYPRSLMSTSMCNDFPEYNVCFMMFWWKCDAAWYCRCWMAFHVPSGVIPREGRTMYCTSELLWSMYIKIPRWGFASELIAASIMLFNIADSVDVIWYFGNCCRVEQNCVYPYSVRSMSAHNTHLE